MFPKTAAWIQESRREGRTEHLQPFPYLLPPVPAPREVGPSLCVFCQERVASSLHARLTTWYHSNPQVFIGLWKGVQWRKISSTEFGVHALLRNLSPCSGLGTGIFELGIDGCGGVLWEDKWKLAKELVDQKR